MPLRFRWSSKEYLPVGLLLFGLCGLFQSFYILLAQFAFGIGNYLVVILIPLGVTIALFYGSIIIFESFEQVEQRKKMRSQFQKSRFKNEKLKKFLNIPIVRPLLLLFGLFSGVFFIAYFITIIFATNIISFILAENIAAIVCLFTANVIEKSYARIKRI